ncbi:hypothetical protein OAP24_03185 [Porticoccaceae bacterium]|jgi:hypothetical protein|nr:hypothetical protein [Porticoccaceae bacterium]
MRVFLLLILLPITLLAQQPEEPSVESSTPAAETEQEQDKNPEDKDFKPSEEISEDFPVPLPSDI